MLAIFLYNSKCSFDTLSDYQLHYNKNTILWYINKISFTDIRARDYS